MAGTLLIIGGHENKEDAPSILRALVERMGARKLVVATVASEIPDELWATYEETFHRLGLKDVAHLDIRSREEAASEESTRMLDGAAGVLFTGGDQLRITSRLGGTPVHHRIEEIFRGGGLIAGTSAGAAVMSEMMLVRGESTKSYRFGTDLRMAPGFGFIAGVIIDQHFTERGRMSRLIGAVALNPRVLGIGLDEDTAILVESDEVTVLGSGAAYILDGAAIEHSNLAEADSEQTISIFGLKLHILSEGDRFQLSTLTPRPAKAPGG